MSNIWITLNEEGVVINRFLFDDGEPTQVFPNHKHMRSTGVEQIGWTYKNGKFNSPAEHTPNPPPLPERPKTQEQKDIDSLKSDIQTLTQSLTQVITALNALTKTKVANPHVE